MTKKNRFDLEQEIMDCWRLVDDIRVVQESLSNGDLSTDKLSTILLGMHELYQLKFDNMFRTFESCISNREFNSYSVVSKDDNNDNQPLGI